MKKTIEIDGKINKEGTTAYILNVQAAKEGYNSLTEYIRIKLNEIADQLKK